MYCRDGLHRVAVELDDDLGAPFCELQRTKTKTAAGAPLEIPRFELLPDADLAAARARM